MELTFSELLTRHLKAAGLFQGDFASLVGLSRSEMSRVANGAPPDVDALEKWADVLELRDAERADFIVAGTMATAPVPVQQLFRDQRAEVAQLKTELLTLHAMYDRLLLEIRRHPTPSAPPAPQSPRAPDA